MFLSENVKTLIYNFS